MKVHNNLEKLLEAYGKYVFIWQKSIDLEMYNKDFVESFLATNSLALGKTEPLAKNKHTERVCKACVKGLIVTELGFIRCSNCKGTGLKNSKDATSR